MFALCVSEHPERPVTHGQHRAVAAMERLAQVLRRWRERIRGSRSLSLSRQTVAMRLITPAAALVIAAILGGTGLAYLLAKEADDYLESEHRQALAGAVEALQAVSPDLSRVEPQLIHVLERASGLKDLRFRAALAAARASGRADGLAESPPFFRAAR